MSQLEPSLLETHDTNTGNVNGVVVSNWERLNQMMDQAAVTYAATVNVDLSLEQLLSLPLTGNVTLNTANRLAGRRMVLRIVADASIRSFTFNASWVWVGATPTTIAANKTAILELWCFGTAETDIVARYTVQP